MWLGVWGAPLALAEKTTINNVTIRGYVMEASGAPEVQERYFSEIYGK